MRPRAALGALAAGLLASACLVVRPDPVSTPDLTRLAAPAGRAPGAVVLFANQGPRSPFHGGNPPVDYLHTHGLEPGDTQVLLSVLRDSRWFTSADLGREDGPGTGLRLDARYDVREAVDWDTFLLGYLTMTLVPVRGELEIGLDLTVSDGGDVLGTVTCAERLVSWNQWLLLPFGLFGQPLGKVQRVRAELLGAALAEARLRGWL